MTRPYRLSRIARPRIWPDYTSFFLISMLPLIFLAWSSFVHAQQSSDDVLTVAGQGATLYNDSWEFISLIAKGTKVTVTEFEGTSAIVRLPDGRTGRILLSQTVEYADRREEIPPVRDEPEQVPGEPESIQPETPADGFTGTPSSSITVVPAARTTRKEIIQDVFVDRESRSIDSRLEIDLKASGEDKDELRRTFSATTSLGLELEVERGSSGYYLSGAVEYDVDYSKTESDDNGTREETRSDAAGIRIKGFSEFGWDEYLTYGRKWYLTPQSPYFVYTEGQLSWAKRNDGSTDDLETPATNAAAGIGYGRVVNIAAFERIVIVQNELLAAGVLTRRLSRDVIRQLLPFYIRAMDHYDRMVKTQDILVANGLVTTNDITLDISYEIYDAISSSFDKRKYGLELKASYFQEVSKPNNDLDKYAFIAFFLRWEYPITLQHQISVEGDASSAITDGYDYTDMSVLAELSSVFGRYLESSIGARTEQIKATEETTTSTAFVTIDYNITDVVTWNNELEYNWYEDESTGFSASSKIVYHLY